MAKAKAVRAAAATQPIKVKPAADPATAFVTASLFDGTRQPISDGTQILWAVYDGAQNQLFREYVNGSSVKLQLPLHNNFADGYSIIAFAQGYEQAGLQPVRIGANAPAQVDLMLVPKDGSFTSPELVGATFRQINRCWRRSSRRV